MPPSNHIPEGGNHRGEDTIVVQSDNYWRNASSPESSPESETEPIVASLLARFQNAPPDLQLESPEPEDQEEQLPEQNARRSSNTVSRISRLPGAGTSEERLQQMPKLRDLPWREGVDPTSEHEVGGDSRRKQIRFGCLLATRGEVQETPCLTCANGRGKFSLCIALEGFFKGACASCQLSGGPNRCTIKKSDDELPNSSTNTPTAEKTQPSSVNTKRPSLSSTKRPSSGDAPNKKRRKTADKVERSEKIPDWESARPQWQQELGDSQARQQMSQVRSPWTTVNQPAAQIPAPAPIQQSMGNGFDGGRSNGIQYPSDRRSSAGWATVNQPAASLPAPSRSYYGADMGGGGYQTSPGGYHSNGISHQSNIDIGGHQNGASQANTQPGILHSNGAGYQSNIEQQRRESSVPNDEGTMPLIDMLPKYKQRQLYGLVSGLQGGIKHLQAELDTLKKALGMDD